MLWGHTAKLNSTSRGTKTNNNEMEPASSREKKQ